MKTYVLDACAMLAVLSGERGADAVERVYGLASDGKALLVMNKVNLLEVYYNILRQYGINDAESFYREVKLLPIRIDYEVTDELFKEAGRLKALYKISLADSIALAQASVTNGELLTSDHHEFDVVEDKESIRFLWIR